MPLGMKNFGLARHSTFNSLPQPIVEIQIIFYLVKIICFSDRNSSGILEGFHCKGIKNFWLVRHITSNPLPLPVVEINISFATESIRRSHLLLFQLEFFWNSWRISLRSVLAKFKKWSDIFTCCTGYLRAKLTTRNVRLDPGRYATKYYWD